MPPDFPTWFFYVLLGTVAMVPAGKWVVWAIGQQIVAEIRDSLEPFIRDVAREELDAAIDSKLLPLYQQLMPNGGESMHDRLRYVEEAVHTLNLNTSRWDPPTGTPTEGM